MRFKAQALKHISMDLGRVGIETDSNLSSNCFCDRYKKSRRPLQSYGIQTYGTYGHYLSTDTFRFVVGQVVWSQCIVKLEYSF